MSVISTPRGPGPTTRRADISQPPDIAPSQRRLQREPDFTGGRLNRFRQVFLRHGLPGAVLGFLCLLVPEMRQLLTDGLFAFTADPLRYLRTGIGVLGLLVVYTWYLDRRLDALSIGWILYLLALSAWEEWVFRLAIPYFGAAHGANLKAMVVVTNFAFALMHYFTLRWKWQWCLAAFLGGMAFARHFHEHFDLVMIIGIHWIATFVNTPRLPGRGRAAAVMR